MAIFIPGSVGLGSETATEQLGPGLLTNVSLFTENEDVIGSEVHVTVSIARGGTGDGNRTVHLISGYLTRNQPLSWTGLFEYRAEDIMHYKVTGNLAAGIRCQSSMITRTAQGPLMEYLNALRSDI